MAVVRERYYVERLKDRKSWVIVARVRQRDFAEIAMSEIQSLHPKWDMRIREIGAAAWKADTQA